MRAPHQVLACLLLCSAALGAEPAVTWKQDGQEVRYLARNPTSYPITFRLEVDALRNVRSDVPLPVKAVVPPRSERVLATLTPINAKQRWSCGAYRFRWQPGSCEAVPDTRVRYELPFPPGYGYYVVQGYGGSYSHQDLRALDFDMPEGAAIHAARGGRVVRVEQGFKRGGPDKALADYANRIWILHADGTIGRYLHLQPGGAEVKVGQQVEAGDLIGHAGSTGWARGPHLHFDVFVPDDAVQGLNTLAVRFHTQRGRAMELVQGMTPLRPFPPGIRRRHALNALREVVFARGATADDQPRDPAQRFAADDTLHVFVMIGARGAYAVQVSFGQGHGPPLATQELRTKADWDRCWVTQDLSQLNLRAGRPAWVKVSFDGEQVGEASFQLR